MFGRTEVYRRQLHETQIEEAGENTVSRKYDNMMKCAQVRSLFNEKQYRNAYEVIQAINVEQVTALTDLNTIADVYVQLQKYAEAKPNYLK